MPSPAAILRASQLTKAGRPTPGPQGNWGGQMPAGYQAQPGNYAASYGPFLPRPAQDFTEGAFGPFSPILPVPVDMPPAGAERAQPRRWQYPVGENLPIGVPGSEGFKLAPFDQLKTLSRVYSILRTCIQIRKAEIRALDWDIVLTTDAAKAYKGDRSAMRSFGERRAQAIKWFKKPDPNYFTFSSFLDTMLDQMFTIDALTLYLCPTRGRGGGLFGSGLDSLWLIDGAGIRPLTGLHGEFPRPPAVAYQQYEWGVPRSDFMLMRDGRDLDEAGFTPDDLTGQFRGDQMLYLPTLVQADSPYGFSMVERAIVPVITGLQKQAMQLQHFTEGTIPGVYISPGDVNMTPNQIRELQDALNAFAGDQAWMHKVIVLPPGSKTMPQKQMEIVDQADEWIATEVAMVCDINPMELGVLPKVSTVASPFAAREMAQASRTIHQRISTKPTLSFVQEIFNVILQDVAGQQDLRFLFSGMEEVQDQAAVTDMGVKQVQSGIRSIDEFRDMLGLVPWDLPETSEPVVFTQMGPVPLGQAASLLGLPPGNQAGANGSKPAGTAAHAAAQGHQRVTASASNRSNQPGSVTERQRARGGALAPQHATGTGAPGRATGKPVPKAAVAELEALGRHLRKGRDIATWEPVNLPPAVLTLMKADLADGHSVTTAVQDALLEFQGMLAKAGGAGPKVPPGTTQTGQTQQQQSLNQQFAQLGAQYAQQINAAFGQALGQAARLIAQWAAGTLAVTLAVLVGMITGLLAKALAKVLRKIWKAAWRLGTQAAEGQAGGKGNRARDAEALAAFLATVGADLAGLISTTRMRQLEDALRTAIRNGEDPQAIIEEIERILRVASRAAMIADTEVTRAANAAQIQVFKDLGIAYKTWHTRNDSKVCGTCMANQNQGPVPLSATFKSGLVAPPQHSRCRCWIAGWTPPAPAATKVLTRRVMDNGEVVFEDADAPDANPSGGGALTGPYPHRAAGDYIPGGVPGATAGGEPPRWDGTQVEPHLLSLPSGDDGEQGGPRGAGAGPATAFPAPYMDGYWPGGGHGSAQPPASPIGGENGRPPNEVGKVADAAARFLADAPKAKASTVFAQLSRNYPPDSIAWVHRCDWVGPVELPLDLVDFGNRKEWAAHHETARVNEFARDLKAHRKVDPVVAVMRPDHNHVRIIDGHHRSLACKKIGWPVRAYIGTPRGKTDLKAAYEAHLYQEHQGSSEENKSFTAGAMGGGSVSGLTPFNLAGQVKRSKESVDYRKAEGLLRQCGNCSMFIAGGSCTDVAGKIKPVDTCDIWAPRIVKAAKAPYVAGLMVRAADTGRVLMLQRSLDDDQDHAAGKWENPGGHQEPGETLLQAAAREWQEETGMTLPQGTLTGSWDGTNGIYRGYVLTIPSETGVEIFAGRDQVWDPDDPHGDKTQAIAWWDPGQFAGNPSVRPEMQDDLALVLDALGGSDVAKSAETPMLEATPDLLGTHGLWHTPDRHVGERQKLPNYIEHIAHALMRDQGMGESQAIATAINAVKRWARGDLHWGRGKVSPEVRAASQRALQEWDDLKRSHEG
jgi:SPP1 gp7 family putative phage head morphogenesis protein